MDTKANDPELVFVGEGLLSITSIIDPAKMKFTAEDFAYVENLYSSIFVLSASADLNIKTIADLEAYVAAGNEISVAVNGATSSEAFLARSLFGKMGAGDQAEADSPISPPPRTLRLWPRARPSLPSPTSPKFWRPISRAA